VLPHLPCYQERLHAVYDSVRMLYAELIVLDLPADDAIANLVRLKLLQELMDISTLVTNFSNVVGVSICEELLKLVGLAVQLALSLLQGGGGVMQSTCMRVRVCVCVCVCAVRVRACVCECVRVHESLPVQ